jgi:HAE1 family hydrophobic/amphiphilic exporter-1
MTTVMLVAAMIPIATGQGMGAAARASMAKVILGGQLLSLLLSLLVTPVAYSLWDDFTVKLKKFAAWCRRPWRAGGVSPPSPAVVAESVKETVLDAPAANGDGDVSREPLAASRAAREAASG